MRLVWWDSAGRVRVSVVGEEKGRGWRMRTKEVGMVRRGCRGER